MISIRHYINSFFDWCDEQVANLNRKICVHDEWRPALTSQGPAKHCSSCNTTVQITEAEFYALFGRMPNITSAC